MLAIILSLLALLVVAVLLYAATRPDTLHIERSLLIQAPAETILAHVNDFHRWRDWSPYEKLEPDMRREIGGAPGGIGATYAWQGQGKAGAGRMEITDSRSDRTTSSSISASPSSATTSPSSPQSPSPTAPA